jgi:hypothetical protein
MFFFKCCFALSYIDLDKFFSRRVNLFQPYNNVKVYNSQKLVLIYNFTILVFISLEGGDEFNDSILYYIFNIV